MKVVVAVLTYNRLDLLKSTLSSIAQADYCHTLLVVDNGSTDGSAEYVKSIGGYCNETGRTSYGYGINLAVNKALATQPDLIVFSADDYTYVPGWLRRLVAWWQDVPVGVLITSVNLEPDYPWNSITRCLAAGGERGVLRTSLPGSSWTFRAEDWEAIGPVREATLDSEDLEICRRLTGFGYLLAALDLSEHSGERVSACHNMSWTIGKPVDKTKWGLMAERI